MAAAISSSIIVCLKSLSEFVAEIKRLPQAQGTGLGLAPEAWEDELGRLRMWAANIGDHQTGQSSLDFRLRDSSYIRQQILKLLDDLQQRLKDAREVLAEDEKEGSDASTDEFSDDEETATEIQELKESLATIINCLFQMSMLVRRPAQHDMILGSRKADVAMFEPFDYNHVRDKYPDAENSIVERLGLALTRRRKYLKYRERHALKLREGINKIIPEDRSFEEIHESENVAEGPLSVLSYTIATDMKNSNIIFDDGASGAASQTSYASTLLYGGDITIPPPPKSSRGGVPFECPYCHFVITSKGTMSWNRHVFQDLQPYICIASTCATPDKLYATKHEWLHHLKATHLTESGTGIWGNAVKRESKCPLCSEEFDAEKDCDRHVARHLQELALFILPRNEDDSDVGEDASNADTGSKAGSVTSDQLPESRELSLEVIQESGLVLQYGDSGKLSDVQLIKSIPVSYGFVLAKVALYRSLAGVGCNIQIRKVDQLGYFIIIGGTHEQVRHVEKVINVHVEDYCRRESTTDVDGDSAGAVDGEDEPAEMLETSPQLRHRYLRIPVSSNFVAKRTNLKLSTLLFDLAKSSGCRIEYKTGDNSRRRIDLDGPVGAVDEAVQEFNSWIADFANRSSLRDRDDDDEDEDDETVPTIFHQLDPADSQPTMSKEELDDLYEAGEEFIDHAIREAKPDDVEEDGMSTAKKLEAVCSIFESEYLSMMHQLLYSPLSNSLYSEMGELARKLDSEVLVKLGGKKTADERLNARRLHCVTKAFNCRERLLEEITAHQGVDRETVTRALDENNDFRQK